MANTIKEKENTNHKANNIKSNKYISQKESKIGIVRSNQIYLFEK